MQSLFWKQILNLNQDPEDDVIPCMPCNRLKYGPKLYTNQTCLIFMIKKKAVTVYVLYILVLKEHQIMDFEF